MGVILDSQVLLSALISPRGAPRAIHAALKKFLQGHDVTG